MERRGIRRLKHCWKHCCKWSYLLKGVAVLAWLNFGVWLLRFGAVPVFISLGTLLLPVDVVHCITLFVKSARCCCILSELCLWLSPRHTLYLLFVVLHCRDIVQPLIPGCSLVLTLLDEGSSESGTATQHIMLSPAAYESSSDSGSSPNGSSPFLNADNEGVTNNEDDEISGFLPPVQLPLTALPSVQAVCQGHRLLFTSEFQGQAAKSTMNFSDWRDLARTYGMDCFLAVPLCFAQHDMGTLLLMSSQPAALDKHVRKLVLELGLVVSQTMYTLLCMQQMRAGDYIINDILPEKVRDCVFGFCYVPILWVSSVAVKPLYGAQSNASAVVATGGFAAC